MPAPKGNQFAKGNKGGRPTRYNKKYAEKVYELALLGMIDKKIADQFEINVSTFYAWKKNHKEFSDSIKKGRVEADTGVVDSLYKKAMGYETQEEHIIYIDDGTGRPKVKEKKVIKKHVPADTGAAIFWLKNRHPEEWRDKINLDHTTKGDKLESKITLNIDGEKIDFKE